MKTYPTNAGPFEERPFFEEEEMESIARDELRSVSLLPDTATPVRIDRFIEKRFGVVPSYENIGPGVLGYTKFGTDGAKEVVISRALSEEGSLPAERRERSTLAHEAGHILLHSHLFALQPSARSRPLFEDDVDVMQKTVLCRDQDCAVAYDGRWWEYQANQMIGLLLLPRSLVFDALGDLTMTTALGVRGLDPAKREVAARRLADTFNVNPTVARRRIERLFRESSAGQLTL
jgi:hypothetical protein